MARPNHWLALAICLAVAAVMVGISGYVLYQQHENNAIWCALVQHEQSNYPPPATERGKALVKDWAQVYIKLGC